MNGALSKLKAFVEALLYPRRCLLCQKTQEAALCDSCRKGLGDSDVCLRCERELQNGFCVPCGRELGGERLFILSSYDKLNPLIQRLKRGRDQEWDWAELLFPPQSFGLSDGIVLVPSTAQKSWMEACLPVKSGLLGQLSSPLARHPQKLSQKQLQGKQRASNAVNLFYPDDDSAIVPGKVHLVDDVLSTGRSLGACAGVLRDLGYEVASIRVLSFRKRQAGFEAGGKSYV